MKEAIKFMGNDEDLVWIYPKSSFPTDATIKVDMGFEAIMMRDGEIELPFIEGTHNLFEEEKGFSLFKKNKTVHDCIIYFFNKSRHVKTREWGTRHPIKYHDPHYKMELAMRGHGSYKIKLENHRLFLKNFKIDPSTIAKLETSIKDVVIAKLTEIIARVLTSGKYDLLSIHSYYADITKAVEKKLNDEFEPSGFSIFDLKIARLTPVEEEKIEQLRELQFKSQVFNSEFEMVNKVRQANNEDKLIQNQVDKQANFDNQHLCPNCNTFIDPFMKFCSNCGKNLKLGNGE